MSWSKVEGIGAKRYRCGYCGEKVSSSIGYYQQHSAAKIFICPDCDCPTYFNAHGSQYPGVAFGNKVEHVPENIRISPHQ